MLVERRKNPHGPGGRSIHLYWPLWLTLYWQTDWELRYLPALFDALVLFVLAHLFLLLV